MSTKGEIPLELLDQVRARAFPARSSSPTRGTASPRISRPAVAIPGHHRKSPNTTLDHIPRLRGFAFRWGPYPTHRAESSENACENGLLQEKILGIRQ